MEDRMDEIKKNKERKGNDNESRKIRAVQVVLEADKSEAVQHC